MCFAIPSCVAVLVALLGYDRGDTGSHEHVYLDTELGIDQVAFLEDRRNRVWFCPPLVAPIQVSREAFRGRRLFFPRLR